MPSHYVVRQYKKDGVYHVFNRGVEKRKIFIDKQDYRIFVYYLFIYLVPLEKVLEKYQDFPIRLYRRNLNKKVNLLAYCLMPNHFHLLVHQIDIDGVQKLLKQITNAYTQYFNNKYSRVGSLFQGRFKAVLIEDDEILIHVARYIHLNPIIAGLVDDLSQYLWSSYFDYKDQSADSICDIGVLLSYFSDREKLLQFMQDQIDYAKKIHQFKHTTIDSENDN